MNIIEVVMKDLKHDEEFYWNNVCQKHFLPFIFMANNPTDFDKILYRMDSLCHVWFTEVQQSQLMIKSNYNDIKYMSL